MMCGEEWGWHSGDSSAASVMSHLFSVPPGHTLCAIHIPATSPCVSDSSNQFRKQLPCLNPVTESLLPSLGDWDVLAATTIITKDTHKVVTKNLLQLIDRSGMSSERQLHAGACNIITFHHHDPLLSAGECSALLLHEAPRTQCCICIPYLQVCFVTTDLKFMVLLRANSVVGPSVPLVSCLNSQHLE